MKIVKPKIYLCFFLISSFLFIYFYLAKQTIIVNKYLLQVTSVLVLLSYLILEFKNIITFKITHLKRINMENFHLFMTGILLLAVGNNFQFEDYFIYYLCKSLIGILWVSSIFWKMNTD